MKRTLAVAIAAFSVFFMHAVTANAAWEMNGRWRLNELSGTVANGTPGPAGRIFGGVTLGRPGAPSSGTSFGFDGTGIVTLENMSVLSPGNRWLRVSVHIKTQSKPAVGTDYNVFRNGEFETTRGFKIEILPGGYPSCSFKGTRGHVNNVTFAMDVADGLWHRIRCVLRRVDLTTDEVILAVDGKIRARKIRPIGSINYTIAGGIGHYRQGVQKGGFIGDLDNAIHEVCTSECPIIN